MQSHNGWYIVVVIQKQCGLQCTKQMGTRALARSLARTHNTQMEFQLFHFPSK